MGATLLQFRTAIAIHLGRVLEAPAESLLALVQQDTAHRKAGHGVFSVVIKRLPCGPLDEERIQQCVSITGDTQEYVANARRAKDMLLFDPAPGQLIRMAIQDTYTLFGSEASAAVLTSPVALGKRDREHRAVIVNGLSLQQDENGHCALRRIVVTGFVSRLVGAKGATKVFCEHTDGNESIRGLFRGLDIASTVEDISSIESHLRTIEETIRTSKEIKTVSKDESWLVQLSLKGQVKVYTRPSSTTSATSTAAAMSGPVAMGTPTPLVQTLALIASHFSEYDALDRYIWVVPDGRRQFAEQLLELAKMIYNPREMDGSEDAQERTKRSWPDLVEVVVFGPAGAGQEKTDTESSNNGAPARMARIMEYAKAEMSKIIVENRGGSLGGDGYEDEDYEEDRVALDEDALSRMATILAESAIVVACAGTRRLKKLNVNMKQLLDGKGNSGVFLQYVLSRLCGIERKSGTRLNPGANLLLLQPYPEAFHLALVIAEWADIQDTLTQSLDPYPLANYLFHLAAEIGQANRVLRVKDMDVSVAEARWLLFWCAKRVLEHGLALLGLESVERM